MRGLDERIGSPAIVEGAYRAVQIIYLDQNKWIDLARAVKYPADYPEVSCQPILPLGGARPSQDETATRV
jgi:hypothetical protein